MKNFSDLTQHLKESVKSDAKKDIAALKKAKKSDDQIINAITKKYKDKLSSIDILSLMEKYTHIPVTGKLKHITEVVSSDELEGNYIVVLDEKAEDKIYVEGSIKFQFIECLETQPELQLEKYCDLCDSDEHNKEDCDNLEEVCETHAAKVVQMCKEIRNVINPLYSNKQVFEFLSAMSEAKGLRNEKYFSYDDVSYSIAEQTAIIAEQFEDGSDKNVVGFCTGRLYEVLDGEYPQNCEYIKLKAFSKGI